MILSSDGDPVAPKTTRRPFDEILTLACRAPSVHNTQPWLWRLRGDELELWADLSRQVLQMDPDGRDLALSCGAALHHVQVAARGLGWRAEVTRLPDPRNHRRLASITLEPVIKPQEAIDEMMAISSRQTDRRRFTSWPVPPERLDTLARIGEQWGAAVVPITDESARARLRTLTRRADEAQSGDPAYQAELAAHLNDRSDGMSIHAVPIEPDEGNRTFPTGTLEDQTRPPVGDPEGILVICTEDDSVLCRLRAGEAMSAIWLRATMDGFRVVPLSQALEVEETRQAVQGQLLEGRGFPQIILRVGWPPIADTEPLPASRRRPLDDVLIREPAR
ncbi:Acg family FMN-binding oxidoreductase [Nocardioides sp.]|uniref:Acg family FMN-binding oxidoreductase n=1 Tax=Nocardioides sp. TaxID=35761 RepID=UPI003D0B84CE